MQIPSTFTDEGSLAIYRQIPIVVLFCWFMWKLVGKHLEYMHQRDQDMKESIAVIAQTLETMSNRIRQNTIAILGIHPDVDERMRAKILDEL